MLIKSPSDPSFWGDPKPDFCSTMIRALRNFEHTDTEGRPFVFQVRDKQRLVALEADPARKMSLEFSFNGGDFFIIRRLLERDEDYLNLSPLERAQSFTQGIGGFCLKTKATEGTITVRPSLPL